MNACVHAALGFMSREGVAVDTVRPGGVLRAPTLTQDPNVYPTLEKHTCTIQDLLDPACLQPQLPEHGFEKIVLPPLPRFQSLLAALRSSGHLTPDLARQLGRALIGRRLPLQNGKSARIVFIANEGTMMRVTGPNGLIVNADSTANAGINHKLGAPALHGDQDVRGTPVRQMLFGFGPWLLHHEAPDGANRRSPLFLMNLWVPLHQITRPLALMNERSWNRRAHQLRYALPVSHILERDESQKLNDIWTVLHDPSQQWFFSSEMDSRHAYVFNTLSNPHGAFSIPGEDIAEQRYRALDRCLAARDTEARRLAARFDPVALPAECTPRLREAVAAMEQLLWEAAGASAAGLAADWPERARNAMDRVVRKSIEMRMLAWVS